jgi:uncharacterized oxidoreductase
MILKDKTVLITGGSSGIGLEAANQFLANGAKVIITGRDEQKLNAAKKLYPTLITIKSDAGNQQDAVSLFKQITDLGGIDILYNNAGVLTPPSNLGMPNEQHLKSAQYEMDVNFLGVIHLNNLFLDMLKSKRESAIINTTSILSYVPSIIEPTYSASKVALRFYTESLRVHLKILKANVKVFELLPPVVATEMTADRSGRKITPEQLVKELISALKRDQFTIRVGDTRLVYLVSRFFPKLAFRAVNSRKTYNQLQS